MSAIQKLIDEKRRRKAARDIDMANKAAAELADYELRLDLLAKGATWEHNENADLKEQLAAKDEALRLARELSAKWKRESAELTAAGGIMNAQLSVVIMFYVMQLDAALAKATL